MTDYDYLREYEDDEDYSTEAWYDEGEGDVWVTPEPNFWEKIKAEMAYLKSLIFPRVEPAYHYMLEDEIPF